MRITGVEFNSSPSWLVGKKHTHTSVIYINYLPE